MKIVKWKRTGPKLGTRVLKVGMQGHDVCELQTQLKNLGYEPGACDGKFGYLTLEAMRFFQRDYGLQIDGIAGDQVYALIKYRRLPITRRVHEVQPGETLIQIAQRYKVGPTAFREYKPNLKLYPGQELTLFDREVWGIISTSSESEDTYQTNQELLTGYCVPYDLSTDDELRKNGIQDCTEPGLLMPFFPAQSALVQTHNLLTSYRKQKALIKKISNLSTPYAGIYLPWDCITRGDGQRYYRFLRKLRKTLETRRLLITLTSRMPRWNIFGGIDFAQASSLVDQIVIKPELPLTPQPLLDKSNLEKMIVKMLNYIPAYKVLLNISIYALLWNVTAPETKPEVLSHKVALTQVFRYGGRLDKDDQGSLFYRFYQHQAEKQIRVASVDQIDQAVRLVNNYNLAGLVIDSIGAEDQRMWQNLNKHFSIAKDTLFCPVSHIYK